MAILRQVYSRGGELAGMPIINEDGIFSDEAETLADLTSAETGRVELFPLPRTIGLVAKSLDGQTISDKVKTLTTPFGSFDDMLQMGKTQMVQIAPAQPIGPTGIISQKIFSYRRQWVQLSDWVEPEPPA